jgi:hypothetical protein
MAVTFIDGEQYRSEFEGLSFPGDLPNEKVIGLLNERLTPGQPLPFYGIVSGVLHGIASERKVMFFGNDLVLGYWGLGGGERSGSYSFIGYWPDRENRRSRISPVILGDDTGRILSKDPIPNPNMHQAPMSVLKRKRLFTRR